MKTYRNTLPDEFVVGDADLADAIGLPLKEIHKARYRIGKKLPLTEYRLGRTVLFDAAEVRNAAEMLRQTLHFRVPITKS